MEEMIRLFFEAGAFIIVMGMIGLFIGAVGSLLALIWYRKGKK